MYSIAIMMSTYNGEKFLKEQLDSILSQEGVSPFIYIRDDGSTDETIAIIKEYMKIHTNITLYKEKNIGWKKSFLKLLTYIPHQYDFYAFSDQDDVWLPRKLLVAVEWLSSQDKRMACYCSNQTFVDVKLNKIQVEMEKKFNMPNNFHSIVNGYGMGCTMVFSRELLKLLLQGDLEKCRLSHDVLVSLLGDYFGIIFRDEKSHILYRQHNDNAGSKNEKIVEKMKNILNFEGVFIYDAVSYLDTFYKKMLTYKQQKIIDSFLNMNRLKFKLKLTFNKYVSRDSILGTLKIKTYILLFRKRERE